MKEEKLSKEDQFKLRLKSIYGNRAEEIIKSHLNDKLKTFRTNHLKKSENDPVESLKDQGFEIQQGPLEDSFICLNETADKRLSDTVEAKSMHIYIQELSSMIPVFIIDLKQGDAVLDICAAPGSKTTQIADKLQNKGEIIANEQSRDRFFKLQKILKDYRANVKTLNENGKILPYKYKNFVQYFDKILLDVPCSNEASLRLDNPDSFKFWRSSNSSGLSKLQKGLLAAAISMLKPGGTLVYSTCTYAVEENEAVVDWALKKFNDIKLVDFTEDFKINNSYKGLTEYKSKKFDSSLDKTVRILPVGEFKGFYLAKLKKIT